MGKYMECLDKKRDLYIHEIFDAMQSEFHVNNSMPPDCMWTHDTRYLLLKKCKNKKRKAVEMSSIDLMIEKEDGKDQIEEDDDFTAIADVATVATAKRESNTNAMESDVQMLEMCLSVSDGVDGDKEGDAATGDFEESSIHFSDNSLKL